MNRNEFEEKIRKLENVSYKICSKLLCKQIVILPAGRFYRLTIRELSFFDIWADKLADNDPVASRGATEWRFYDRKYTAEQTRQIITEYGNTVNYMITSRPFRQEIEKQLVENGICKDNIFYAPVRMGDLVSKVPFRRRFEVFEHFGAIQDSAAMLADEASREELWGALAIFCANAPVWKETIPSEEYFNTPYINIGEGEIFVDAGMYNGLTTRRFVEICPSYKAVYGIEANPLNMDMIHENLENLRDIHIYNNALCNAEDVLRFGGIKEGAKLMEKGETEVKGIRGDSLHIAPTFMKFDIEGAEYDALQGFKNTIQIYRPKMAISVYHSLEDHWRIIAAIKEICPDYRLYLKHHYGYEDMYGTILYATVS